MIMFHMNSDVMFVFYIINSIMEIYTEMKMNYDGFETEHGFWWAREIIIQMGSLAGFSSFLPSV